MERRITIYWIIPVNCILLIKLWYHSIENYVSDHFILFEKWVRKQQQECRPSCPSMKYGEMYSVLLTPSGLQDTISSQTLAHSCIACCLELERVRIAGAPCNNTFNVSNVKLTRTSATDRVSIMTEQKKIVCFNVRLFVLIQLLTRCNLKITYKSHPTPQILIEVDCAINLFQHSSMCTKELFTWRDLLLVTVLEELFQSPLDLFALLLPSLERSAFAAEFEVAGVRGQCKRTGSCLSLPLAARFSRLTSAAPMLSLSSAWTHDGLKAGQLCQFCENQRCYFPYWLSSRAWNQ